LFAVAVAAVEIPADGGVLWLAGVVEDWLSFAACGAAWMMTVRAGVDRRPRSVGDDVINRRGFRGIEPLTRFGCPVIMLARVGGNAQVGSACTDILEIVMSTGTVKWFNPTKGYGFIQPQGGGQDVFVHISAVEKAGLSTLNEGQQVEFEVVSNRGKSSAENLKVK
jgi:cold shock protein